MTPDVGLVDYLWRWCVCSRSAVNFFNRLQSFYCRLDWSALMEGYLAFSTFHLSIKTAKRFAVVIHNSSADEFFYAVIIRNQIRMLLTALQNRMCWIAADKICGGFLLASTTGGILLFGDTWSCKPNEYGKRQIIFYSEPVSNITAVVPIELEEVPIDAETRRCCNLLV